MGRKYNSGLSIGAIGQISIENYQLLDKLLNQAEIGDIVVSHLKNKYLENISHRIDKDSNNMYDIVGHGSPYYIEYQINGMKEAKPIFHREFSRILKHRSDYKKGMSIRLLSCNTGSVDFGFAQKLANKMNAVVYAPNTYYWAYPNGEHLAAGKNSKGEIDLTKPGKMIAFYPGGRRK